MASRLVVLTCVLTPLAACDDSRLNVLVPDGSPSLVVMDFTDPLPLDPVPDGWYHRRFWRYGPMAMSFGSKEGVSAIRLATHGTASMLFRHVEIDLAFYPTLVWRWYVEDGIDSLVDEATRAGDDHPVRVMVVFEAADRARHPMEIIWSNRRFEAGDYMYIDSFPHYVANGRPEQMGRWHREQVDLSRIYRELWGDPTGARIMDVGLFCDSDQTADPTVAYVADVRVEQADVD